MTLLKSLVFYIYMYTLMVIMGVVGLPLHETTQLLQAGGYPIYGKWETET